MPIILGYIGFSLNPGFPETDIITRFFKDGDRVSTNLSEINILIIGDFITMKELEMIRPYRGLRILYVAEPVLNLPFCSIAGQIFRQKKYNAVIGCISNRGDTHNWIKYPIYRYYMKFTKDSFIETNVRVSSMDVNPKAFCTLINRHDWGNTRTPIYERLAKVGAIACPGKLFNNCSNEELNRIGNVDYIKKFWFNVERDARTPTRQFGERLLRKTKCFQWVLNNAVIGANNTKKTGVVKVIRPHFTTAIIAVVIVW